MTVSNRIKLGLWLRKHKTSLTVAQSFNKFLYTTTGSTHLLPDFLIIGAARSGTTSLYEYLIQHPSIMPAVGKEVYFFDKKYDKGINWYRSFFPTKLSKSRLENQLSTKCITGEATPRYLYHPHTPKRVKEYIPNVKLIALLRNPIERAYSHYQMSFRKGNENLSFEEAIEKEEERIRIDAQKMFDDENFYSVDFYLHSYLTRGIYAVQLERWFKYFPREQFLILNSEDFYKNTKEVYKRVLDFLDVPDFIPDISTKHKQKEYSSINPKTRENLVDYFKPHNERLYKLLGVNFNWK